MPSITRPQLNKSGCQPRPPLDPALDEFLDHKGGGAKPWSTANLSSARCILNRYTQWLRDERDVDLLGARFKDCHAYMAQNIGDGGQELKPATIQVRWRMLRAFYKWAATPMMIGGAGLDPAKNPMSGVAAPTITEPINRVAYPSEVEAMFRQYDRSRLGRRDAAILSLMFHNGLRVGELVHLDLAHYRENFPLQGEAVLLIPKTKTDQPREVPVFPMAQKFLRRWIMMRGREPGPLFLGETTRTADIDGRLKVAAIRLVIDRAAERARVPVSSHQLRRAFVVQALLDGISESTVCQVCGWRDKRMMWRYMGEQRLEVATAEVFGRSVLTDRGLRAVAS